MHIGKLTDCLNKKLNMISGQKNIFLIRLTQADSLAISNALVAYANAAYPSCGSECSQATNQTLKELAERISHSHETPVQLKKRQHPMIKAAIRWFYNPENTDTSVLGIDPEKLIECCSMAGH